MNRLWKGRFRWGRLLLVWLVFLLLAGALFAERSGVQYTAAHVQIGALDHAPVSYTHLRAHETDSYLVCRLLLEKKKQTDRSHKHCR